MENRPQPYKVFIIAGERSGDLHGAHLVRELKRQHPRIEITSWGGDQMEEAGAKVSVHYRKLAFMGFWEVFKNLLTISKLLARCKKEIVAFVPDAVILIDYPGFNLKIAKFTAALKIKTFYYIAPKAWAWKENRAYQLRDYVQEVFVIFPFEEAFFSKFGVNVSFVGNPLIHTIESFVVDNDFYLAHGGRPPVAVLPGSRAQEVVQMMALLPELVANFPEQIFLVAAVDNLPASAYEAALQLPNVTLVYNKAYDILSVAKAAIITSGTASLETALFNVPQVVCYRTSAVTYAIAKRLVKINFISLVNLIANRLVVPELIQDDFSVVNVTNHLQQLLNDTKTIDGQKKGYASIKKALSEKSASKDTASKILSALGSF